MIKQSVNKAVKHIEKYKGRQKGGKKTRILDRNYNQRQVQTRNSREVVRRQQRETWEQLVGAP